MAVAVVEVEDIEDGQATGKDEDAGNDESGKASANFAGVCLLQSDCVLARLLLGDHASFLPDAQTLGKSKLMLFHHRLRHISRVFNIHIIEFEPIARRRWCCSGPQLLCDEAANQPIKEAALWYRGGRSRAGAIAD
jgi:hypothetical protein